MKTKEEQELICQEVKKELSGRSDYYEGIFTYQKKDEYDVAVSFRRSFIPGRMLKDIGLLCTLHHVSWYVSDICSADTRYSLYIIIY